MRTIIAGSRGITNFALVENAMAQAKFFHGIVPTVIVSGRARGVDLLGERWAKMHGLPIDPHPVTRMMWRENGRSAGHIRNAEMAKVADALVALWDGSSPGTAGMIQIAKDRRLAYCVFEVCT